MGKIPPVLSPVYITMPAFQVAIGKDMEKNIRGVFSKRYCFFHRQKVRHMA